MLIDWIHFTPWSSLIGGLLIGLAGTLLILLNGKIAGISGITAGLLSPVKQDTGWRIAFISGLLLAPMLYQLLFTRPVIDITATPAVLILAGMLVGFGTRLGSGCTSGHGVCGIARRAPRSLVATLVFLSVGMLTASVLRHLITGLG